MRKLGTQKANDIEYHFKDVKSHRNQSINSTKIAYHFLNAGIIPGARSSKIKHTALFLI